MNATAEPASDPESASSEEGEPSRTCVDVTVEDDRWVSVAGFTDLIADLVAETLRAAKLSPATCCVSVALLSDAQVRALNKAFRGKDAPTNVLSFPSVAAALAGGEEPHFLGDVALAYETVVSEAAAQDKTPLQHAAHLVAHGVLHLAGFDHDSEAGAEAMEAAECEILNYFGIPDPYADRSDVS